MEPIFRGGCWVLILLIDSIQIHIMVIRIKQNNLIKHKTMNCKTSGMYLDPSLDVYTNQLLIINRVIE